MHYLFGILTVTGSYLLPGLFNWFVLRFVHHSWWRLPAVRVGLWALPPTGMILCSAWLASFKYWSDWAGWLGMGAFAVFLLQLALAGALLLTGGLVWMARRLGRIRRRNEPAAAKPEVDLGRRRVWQAGLASIPLLAAGSSMVGVAGAAAKVRVKRMPLGFEHLPPDLVGLRILHISDLHLSGLTRRNTVAEILEQARPLAPHLIVLTGDSADDLRLLPDAMTQLIGFAAPLGLYIVLGNHDYGYDLATACREYSVAGSILLMNDGVRLPVGNATICLGGIDDLAGRKPDENRSEFFERRITEAFSNAQDNDFRLLLSHRPDAFDEAARQGVRLTLAGHTHGGQIGLAGRSLLRAPGLYPYPWGHYRIGESHLYTSSGAGQWLPFRLGCPTEAPVIELVQK